MARLTGEKAEKNAVEIGASMMAVSARTAPKTRGIDSVKTIILTGKDLEKLALAMEKKIKERVFIKGLSTRAKSRKYLSKSWQLTRAKKGKQINFVDLNYTGSLAQSFKTEFDKDRVVMGVDNDYNYVEKLGQEERFRKDTMLVPNSEEIIFLEDLVEYSINFVIDQALT